MSVRLLASVIALLCLELVVLLIVSAIRRKGLWGAIWRSVLTLCLLGIVVALIPPIFRLNQPHYFLNHPAPVSDQATIFSFLSVAPVAGTPADGIAAINARNGVIRWQRVLKDPRLQTDQLFQEVTDDNNIYIGTSTPDGKLLQALRARDGSEVWRTLLPSVYLAPDMRLAISNGVIFVALWDSIPPPHEHLFAIRAADGTRLWDASIGHGYVSRVRLVVRADLIYALTISQNDTSVLEALHVLDGKIAWSIEDPDSELDKLVVGQDVIYLVKPNKVSASILIALDPSAGSPRWKRSYPAESLYGPAVAFGDTLYLCVEQFSDKTGTIYGIEESTSAIRWQKTLPQHCNDLRASSDALYVEGDTTTYALRLADGSVGWSHSPGWGLAAIPATEPGVIFVGGDESVPSDNISLFSPGLRQVFTYAVNASDGSVLWGTPVGSVQRLTGHFIT